MRLASPYPPLDNGVDAALDGADASGIAKRLLVVDDEDSIRNALTRFLSTRGFEVENASSGAAALRILGRERFTLMLCDVRMPGMTGLDVLHKALADDPDLAVVMLTAVNDAVTATEALSGGAFDYLVKPVELHQLEGALERALHKRTLVREQRRVEQLIRDEVASRTKELEHEQAALRSLTVSVAETLINAMEAKSIYLRGHSQRVAELAASIADGLSLDADTVEAVRMAGHLHDVGKIGIREEVLNKPGKLTPEEFAHVKDHVRIGMEILAPLQHLGVVLDYIHDHHEHVDGSGYPRGLPGTEISLGGRILCAADTFDALTSRRAYRDPMSPRETVEYLASSVGQLLDGTVYDVLRRIVLRRKTLVFIDDTPA
ncbi:MAG TPA: HD domain-containing phosphohydrolase [Gemmatimonadaceae bacterium]|jgi:cyclic di-GMP phosphodiesterase|nr:HD domain-containing phosphohydrolase [Gemmatimonadaceae bacterium]